MTRNPVARQVTRIHQRIKPGKRPAPPAREPLHCDGCGREITCNRSGNEDDILCIKCVGLYAFARDHEIKD